MTDCMSTEERYVIATHSSNLRCETGEDTPMGDVAILIASGWSPSRIGAALLRLHSEWDGASHPCRMTQAAIDAYALSLDGGKVPLVFSAAGLAVHLAQRSSEASKTANTWHMHEQAIMFGRLKSLPAVREQLTIQADRYRLENPARLASAVLLHFLDDVCPECHGVQREQIKDTPSLSNVACPACHGSGKSRIPCGEAGRKLRNFIDDALDAARVSIKQRLRHG